MGNHILQVKKRIWNGCSDFGQLESIWSKAERLLICEIYITPGTNCFSLSVSFIPHL